MIPISKKFLAIAVILLALGLGFQNLDRSVLFEVTGRINFVHMMLALLTTSGVIALSTSRFAYINQKFGGDESWVFLHRVNLLSILYSQIALPLIAQMIGRVSHGSKERKSYYAPITVLEKSIAFSIMILFGGISSYNLLNKSIIPDGLEAALMIMASTILIVLSTSLLFIFNAKERSAFVTTISKISHLGVFRILSFSIIIQLGILSTYVILALQFIPDAPIITLVGAFAIVVLATSIPIGFGGWGTREATAAGIFMSLGMPPEIGVVIGILYGLLHLLILVASLLVLKPKVAKPESHSVNTYNAFEGINFWPITTLLVMALLPFQIRLPLADGLVTLNCVDIIALVVMINFIILEYISGRIKTIWADQLMWPGLIMIGLMIAIGWFIGWLRFGSNEWATANRLTGLIMVFSYLFMGAAMRQHIVPNIMAKFALVLLYSLTASVVIQIIAHNAMGYQAALFFNWRSHVSGFIADRNALGFMVGLAAVLTIFHTPHSQKVNGLQTTIAVLLTMLIIMVMFSGSRSGIGAVVFILLWLFFAMRRHVLKILITALGTYAFIQCVNLFGHIGSIDFFGERPPSDLLIPGRLRTDTYESGVNLFLDYPVFGAGLGAGIRDTGLVIHNLYLWILGEMGIIGALLCLPLVIAIIRVFFKTFSEKHYPLKDDGKMHALILFVIICGGFSLVQDIAYQRILWLLIGFIMAIPRVEEQLPFPSAR